MAFLYFSQHNFIINTSYVVIIAFGFSNLLSIVVVNLLVEIE